MENGESVLCGGAATFWRWKFLIENKGDKKEDLFAASG